MMKAKAFYILLVIPFLIFSLYTSAQTTELNLDFESWDTTSISATLQDTIVENRVGFFPINWHYRSSHIPEGTGIGQTTDATSGDYAVALSGFYQYEVMRIISGESDQKPGWPIDFRPTRLLGDYKVILMESNCDSLRGYVSVFLSKYNPTNQVRDTLGQGHIVLTETLDEYESFDIPIDYINQVDQPDTLIIMLAKRRFGFDVPPACMECSHVYYDNLHLSTFPTSVEEPIETPQIAEIYPNPAGDFFTVSFQNKHEIHSIQIMNVHGQLIHAYPKVQGELIVDSTHWSQGLYFLNFEHKSTGNIHTQKVMIE